MSEFSINGNKMNHMESELKTIVKKLNSYNSHVEHVKNQLDLSDCAMMNVRKVLIVCEEELNLEARGADSLASGLASCSSIYQKAESTIAGKTSNTKSGKKTKKKQKNEKKLTTKGIFWGAFAELIFDIISPLCTIIKMPYDLLTKGWLAFANDGWEIINSVYTTGNDLAAMVLIGMGYIAPKGSYERQYIWSEAADRKEREGLADEFKSNQNGSGDFMDRFYQGAEKVTRGVDTVSKVYSIYNGVTDFFKDSMENVNHLLKHEKLDIDILGELGVKHGPIEVNAKWLKYYSQEYGYKIIHDSDILSNVTTVKDYVEKLTDGSFGERAGSFLTEMWQNTTPGGIGKDAGEITEKVIDLFNLV